MSRLYFQSVGDPHDQSPSQKPQNCEGNPEELRQEAKRLEGKVSALSSALELQKKDLQEITVEVFNLPIHVLGWLDYVWVFRFKNQLI